MNSAVLEPRFVVAPSVPNRYSATSPSWRDSDVYSKIALRTLLASSAPSILAVGHHTSSQIHSSLKSAVYSTLTERRRAPTRRLTAEEHDVFQLAILDAAEIVSHGRHAEL